MMGWMQRLKFDYLRYGGMATVFVLWVSIGTAMLRAHLGLLDSRPLSYLGTDPRSNWLFSGGLIIAAITMLGFSYYLRKAYKLNNWFSGAVLVGQLGQIIAALVPYGGSGKRWHTIAAFVLAFSIPIMMWLFTKQTENRRQLANKFVMAELVAFVLGLGWFIFTKNAAPFSQILVALVYHGWLMSLSAGLL